MDKFVKEKQDTVRNNILHFGTDAQWVHENADVLRKSHIVEEFGNDKNLTIAVQGYIVKEGLKNLKTELESKVSNLENKLSVLSEDLGNGDVKFVDDYEASSTEVDDIVKTLPNTFSYRYIENAKREFFGSPKVQDNVEQWAYDIVPSQQTTEESLACKEWDEKEKKFYCFNNAVRDLYATKKDLSVVNTMIDGFKDTKLYNLTVRQCNMLGIKKFA